ncbi:hypothetical protein [Thermococcus paralvinellae]|uniref:Cytochrome b561 domain-containing protein n=1 Tax=Thermococcus paralvinellae TaxID=582419 RepID=W0I5T5_9EURY|nr:hypothetical protein [Thermococcus paralvinellae]AHF79810.1 Hypothetical protein TES1_0416 [Thermococcus paralvinellae]
MEPYQIHAILQILAFLSFLNGVYYAKKHTIRMHHYFIFIAVGLTTVAIIYMIHITGGVSSTHGKVGILIYFYVLFTALSGKAFLMRKISRKQHQYLAIIAILLIILQILIGTYTFIL